MTSLAEKTEICALYSDGLTVSAICHRMKRSVSTVYQILKKFKVEHSLERAKGSGRKRKTTAQTDRLIVRAVQANPFVTSSEIKEANPILNVTERTIRNRIVETGQFRSYWAAHKPFTSDVNRAIRIQWCQDHLHWTHEDWKKVMWSDESPFTLRFRAKQRVWRLHNQRYNHSNIKGTVKHDKKIDVWGAFSANGVGNVRVVVGNMDRFQYQFCQFFT